MSATNFGVVAVGEPSFLTILRKGARRVEYETLEKAVAFCRNYGKRANVRRRNAPPNAASLASTAYPPGLSAAQLDEGLHSAVRFSAALIDPGLKPDLVDAKTCKRALGNVIRILQRKPHCLDLLPPGALAAVTQELARRMGPGAVTAIKEELTRQLDAARAERDRRIAAGEGGDSAA